MDGAFQGVDLTEMKVYATSDVAGDWSDFDVELLDEPEEPPDRTMTYIVLGMIAFFVVAGILSFRYRTKFERGLRNGSRGPCLPGPSPICSRRDTVGLCYCP